MYRILITLLLIVPAFTQAAEQETVRQNQAVQHVEQLDAPLYTPFVERYVLDELKQLRTDLATLKVDMMQQVVDREHNAIDRAVTYATDTVTYFFYLIAAASSVLVLVGWSSIREIKERVHSLADQEIANLVDEYEQRLRVIEQQLNQKTRHIEENRERIEHTQELQSLWLRAAQESSAASKIAIYDQILTIRPNDVEALTYKADAVLELNEPQWAANLCQQALAVDAQNGHAFYQLACANTVMGHLSEAIHYLQQAVNCNESYREQLTTDPALTDLQEQPLLQAMLNPEQAKHDPA